MKKRFNQLRKQMISGSFQAYQNYIAYRHSQACVVGIYFRQMEIAINRINLKSMFANMLKIAPEQKMNILTCTRQHPSVKSSQSACPDYSVSDCHCQNLNSVSGKNNNKASFSVLHILFAQQIVTEKLHARLCVQIIQKRHF